MITIQQILNEELGLDLPTDRPITISSPFRNDSSPSFRVYSFEGEEEDYNRGAYDWGEGASYNPPSIIAKIRGISYKEAIDVLANEYKVDFYTDKTSISISDKIEILLQFIELSSLTSMQKALFLERLIFDPSKEFYNYLNDQVLNDMFAIKTIG